MGDEDEREGRGVIGMRRLDRGQRDEGVRDGCDEDVWKRLWRLKKRG